MKLKGKAITNDFIYPHLETFLKRSAFKLKIFQVLFVLVLVMLFSGTIFYVKQEGLTVIESLYFCVVTLSTVGHPSFEPQTTFGKVFTMIYIVGGTGLYGSDRIPSLCHHKETGKREQQRQNLSVWECLIIYGIPF
ncbi:MULTISPECIES: potassium channel family protein [Peribacillus]|uniref:potassium channel family protein n=1 Tax=Peribacillus TaxID=2675229 RepID=UPI00351F763B